MSNKTKRIVNGLGASALAVATIASGLSLGVSAASAEPVSAPRALEVSGTYAKFVMNTEPDTIKGRWNALYKPSSASQYMNRFATEQEAVDAAYEVSVPTSTDWLQMHVKDTDRCLSAFGSTAMTETCSTTSDNQRFKFDGDGRIVNKAGDAGRWIQNTTDDNGLAAVQLGTGTPTLTGEFADGATLSGSVEFAANVDARAAVTGMTVGNGAVEVRRGSVVVGSGSADADGAYRIEITAPNKGGDDDLTVALVENGTDRKTIEVTAVYGAAVAITDPTDGSDVSGPYTVNGTAQAGATVTLQVGDGAPEPVSVSGQGQWSEQIMLPRGEVELAAMQKSKGANTTTSTVTVNPGETEVALTGAGRFDAVDETRPATAFGSAPTGSTVILRNSVGVEIGRTVATGDAYEIAIDPSKATSGVNSFSVVIEGAPGDAKSFTLDYGMPAAAVVVTAPAKDSTVETGAVAFAGTGQVGAKVVVRGSSREVASATVTAQGTWSADSAMELIAGKYDLYFDQTAKGGLKSSIRHAFTVGVTAPVLTPHVVTSPAAGEVVDTLAPMFRGTGHEGAEIVVRGATRVVATGTVSNGQWVAQTDENAPLMPGQYNLYVDQKIRGTVVGTIRVQFEVSSEALRELTLSSPAQGENVTTLRPTWVGTATPGAEIRVGSSRTTVATATVGADGTWRAPALIDLQRGGTYTGLEVKQTTKSGKTSSISSSITVDRNAQ